MRVTCYFDFISPFAYLGWHGGKKVAAELGADLEPRPVLFAALLDHYGQLGPAEVAPKREYMFKHVYRRAHDLGLSLAPPPAHPFNPLLALRAATAALRDPSLAEPVKLIDTLFEATWGGGPGVEDAATIATLLHTSGVDAQGLLAAASAPETKISLRTATQHAIDAGVFGVPTFVVDKGELFWGADALADLARFARGDDPVAAADLERWRTLPATAQRKR